MKVCHLSSVHGRNDPRIRLKECASLARAGHEVILLVADGLGDEEAGGLRIVDAGRRPSGRRKRFLFSARRMLEAARAIDAELYHFHDPELIPAGLALRRAGKLVVYDAHEDLPRQLLSKPYLSRAMGRLLSIGAEVLEDYAARRFSAVVTATATIGARYERHSGRTVVVNNFPSLEEMGLMEAPRVTKEERACYVGGLSVIRGARELLAASALSRYPIAVAGPVDSPALEAELFGPGSRLEYRGVLGRREVSDFIAASMAGLVTFKPAPNHLNSLPTKLFEYMAAGIPVIASDFPLWRTIVEDGGCGICVDPDSPEAIAAAIDAIIGDPDRAEEMGTRGRRLVLENYNWAVEEPKLLALYAELGKLT